MERLWATVIGPCCRADLYPMNSEWLKEAHFYFHLVRVEQLRAYKTGRRERMNRIPEEYLYYDGCNAGYI